MTDIQPDLNPYQTRLKAVRAKRLTQQQQRKALLLAVVWYLLALLIAPAIWYLIWFVIDPGNLYDSYERGWLYLLSLVATVTLIKTIFQGIYEGKKQFILALSGVQEKT